MITRILGIVALYFSLELKLKATIAHIHVGDAIAGTLPRLIDADE